MSNEEMKKSADDGLTYFSYFNHKLYDNPIYFQEEKSLSKSNCKCQSTEEDSLSNNSQISINSIDNEDKYIPLNLLDLSPTKQSHIAKEESIQINRAKKEPKKVNNLSNKEIKPELQKYILPKSLFNLSKKKKAPEEKKKEENPKSSFSSSSRLLPNQLNIYSNAFVPIVPFILINNSSYLSNYGNINKNNNNYGKDKKECSYQEKKKNKSRKNKEFVEREGDWSCYRCKNVNFAFRNKCNKCKMPKEESEEKFIEVGKELLKLADLSIYKKFKD